MNNVPFKLFEVGSDSPEYIVAQTEQEAIDEHLSRIEKDYYGQDELPDSTEVSLDSVASFEQEDGSRKEMTYAEFLGKDFVYTGPQLICWSE